MHGAYSTLTLLFPFFFRCLYNSDGDFLIGELMIFASFFLQVVVPGVPPTCLFLLPEPEALQPRFGGKGWLHPHAIQIWWSGTRSAVGQVALLLCQTSILWAVTQLLRHDAQGLFPSAPQTGIRHVTGRGFLEIINLRISKQLRVRCLCCFSPRLFGTAA